MSKQIVTLALAVGIIFSVACGGRDTQESQGLTVPPTETQIPVTTQTPVPGVVTPTDTPTKAPTETPVPALVAIEGEFFLQLVEPAQTEVFTVDPSLTVVGRTRIDAVVTINDTIVEPNIDGEFSLEVDLEEGPNIIEVVASVANGEQKDLVLVAIYIP